MLNLKFRMPQLIILSLQILYFCLAWLLVTFKITPFSDAWNFISRLPTNDILPEWAVHTHYFFALIFITAGISFTLRLKVMKYINSTALIFLLLLLALTAFSPELYIINLFKFGYIVFIPYIFQKVILQDSKNLQRWIKSSILIFLIYSTYHIGTYLYHSPYLYEISSMAFTTMIVILAIMTSIALYTKNFYKLALNLALVFFIGSSVIDFTAVFQNIQSFDYNTIPVIVISWSMIIFTFWVRKMSITHG